MAELRIAPYPVRRRRRHLTGGGREHVLVPALRLRILVQAVQVVAEQQRNVKEDLREMNPEGALEIDAVRLDAVFDVGEDRDRIRTLLQGQLEARVE